MQRDRGFVGDDKGESYYFVQLADPQFGLMDGVHNLRREASLLKDAVGRINQMVPRPRLVVVSGDMTHSPPSRQDDDAYSKQVAVYQMCMSQLDATIPVVHVPGNHDVGDTPNPETIASYRAHFGADYFVFACPGTSCLVLNSSLYLDGRDASELQREQARWLESRLQELKQRPEAQKYALVFAHHPLVGTSLWPELQDARVRAVFSGHLHRNSVGGDTDGVEQVVTSSVGMPFGADPSGFRVVRVLPTGIDHRYYALADVPTTIDLSPLASLPSAPQLQHEKKKRSRRQHPTGD